MRVSSRRGQRRAGAFLSNGVVLGGSLAILIVVGVIANTGVSKGVSVRNNKHDAIKLLLESWGLYRISGIPGLSYPSQTVEARLMEHGAITGCTPGPNIPRYFRHAKEAQIDRILDGWKDKGGVWPRRYLVTWCQYVGAEGKGVGMGNDPETRIKLKICAAGCSERTYWRTLESVHDILSARVLK